MQKEQKTYRTIMADPPWDIQQKSKGRGAARHYSLMTMEQIRAMPVAALAAPDSHLYLWVTNAALREGFEVMRSWGFAYRSCITWFKPRLGLGSYYRNCTEHILFGTRGQAPVLCKRQPNWLLAPVQDHSHKPEEQYAVMERCSPGPYLELFARRRQPGWDAWGNEIESDVRIPGYPVPKHAKEAL